MSLNRRIIFSVQRGESARFVCSSIKLSSKHSPLQFYEGTYHDAVGTYMFFDHDDFPVVDDPVFDTPATLKYFAKTRKLLKMERVFAMQRTEVLGDLDHNYCIPNIDTIKEAGVPPKYQEDGIESSQSLPCHASLLLSILNHSSSEVLDEHARR